MVSYAANTLLESLDRILAKMQVAAFAHSNIKQHALVVNGSCHLGFLIVNLIKNQIFD